MAFSPDSASKLLDELGVLDAPCDACGAVAWVTGQRESVVSQLEIFEEEIEVVDNDDQPGCFVLAVVCRRCGNSRFHDVGLLG